MSAMARLKELPDWPARMTAPVAASYMGVSHQTFLTRFKEHGRKEGANVFWARAQLDRIIAKQFAIPQPRQPSGEDDGSWDDFK